MLKSFTHWMLCDVPFFFNGSRFGTWRSINNRKLLFDCRSINAFVFVLTWNVLYNVAVLPTNRAFSSAQKRNCIHLIVVCVSYVHAVQTADKVVESVRKQHFRMMPVDRGDGRASQHRRTVKLSPPTLVSLRKSLSALSPGGGITRSELWSVWYTLLYLQQFWEL